MRHRTRAIICTALVVLCEMITANSANADSPPRIPTEQIWDGRLVTADGTTLRLVFHVNTSPSGEITASLDSLDQNAKGIKVDTITVEKNRLAFELNAIGGKYEGVVNSAGFEAVGRWFQGGSDLPLTLMKRDLSSQATDSPPIPTEKPILVLNADGHTGPVSKLIFSRDGKELITVSLDKTIRTWDLATGAERRVLHPPIGSGLDGELHAAALSHDGRTLAVGGIGVATNKSRPIYLISMDTGRMGPVLKGHTNNIKDLAFSPDGARLASCSFDKTARIWDLSVNRCEQVLSGHEAGVMSVAFSADGRRLATASFDKICRIWSVGDGRCEAVMQGHGDGVYCITWSPDGNTVVSGSLDQSIRQWALDGSEIRRFERLGNMITSVRFSTDGGSLLLTRGSKGAFACSILDFVSGQERIRFTGHSDTIQDGTLSLDSAMVATGDASGVVYLWRTADGAVIHRLAGRGHIALATGWTKVGDGILWGNSRKYVSANDLGPLEHRFNWSELERSEDAGSDAIRAPSDLGSISLVRENATKLAVRSSGTTVATITTPVQTRSFTLLAGDRAAVGTQYSLYLADVRTGKLIRRFESPTATYLSVSSSPDGRYILSASSEQVLCIWVPDRGEPLLSLFPTGSDWIAWTPEGYYAASPGGEQLIGWQVNNGLLAMGTYYPAAQFRKALYRPDVIKRLLAAGSLDRALAEADAVRGLQSRRTEVAKALPPSVAITAPALARGQVSGNTLQVEAVAHSVGANPVTEMRVLLDGRPVPDGVKTLPAPVNGEVRGRWKVEVPPGSHRLRVEATSAASKGVSDPVEVIADGAGDLTGAPAGRLLVVIVGINDYLYLGDRFKLDSAVADARSIHKTFQELSDPLFRSIEARLVVDRRATRANILDALQWLKGTARPGDKAVVYYAGHGDNQMTGQFYIIPVDARIEDLRGTGISDDELKQAIGDLPCTTVLMLDACDSGGFGLKKKRKTRSIAKPTDALASSMINDYGLATLCGAKDNQAANEEGGHGYFTQALTRGLAGAADADKDGLVELYELLPYVCSQVKKLSAGDQEPTISIPSTVRSFPLSKP
jgi:WD40 repeat protein